MNTSKRIMLIVGLLLIAGVILIIITGSSKKELKFESMEGQLSLLDKAYASWFDPKIDILTVRTSNQVICNWYQYKALNAENRAGWEDAAEKFLANTTDMIMNSNVKSTYWASEYAFESLYAFYAGERGSKEKIVSQCPDQAEDISKYLEEDRNAFLALAKSEGMLDDKGQIIPKFKPYIHLLHRHLWIMLLAESLPIERLQPVEENITYIRWLVEVSHAPFETKLAKLAQIENEALSDKYDVFYAKGVLFYQNQRYEEACKTLKAGLSQSGASNEFRNKRYQNGIEIIKQEHPEACSETTAQ